MVGCLQASLSSHGTRVCGWLPEQALVAASYALHNWQLEHSAASGFAKDAAAQKVHMALGVPCARLVKRP